MTERSHNVIELVNAVDCHVHVFTPREFPVLREIDYAVTGHEPADLLQASKPFGVTHALLVQPSAYDLDNRCILKSIEKGDGRFLGIAQLPSGASDADFRRLKQGGVVGLRLNLRSHNPRFFEDPKAPDFLLRCRDHGLVAEIMANTHMWPSIIPFVEKSGVVAMIDHLGWPDLAQPTVQPGIEAIVEMGRNLGAIMKLSGPSLISKAGPPYEDVDPFAALLVGAFGVERCVWGSDWPFLRHPERRYSDHFNCMGRWFNRPEDQAAVLWHNPRRIFGFKAL